MALICKLDGAVNVSELQLEKRKKSGQKRITAKKSVYKL